MSFELGHSHVHLLLSPFVTEQESTTNANVWNIEQGYVEYC